ncbi:MAG: hypothetical protein Q9180_006759, partial [Flavoplaca navasiana]
NVHIHITRHIKERISKARLYECIQVIRILVQSIKRLGRRKIDCAIVIFLDSIYQALFGQFLVVVVDGTSAGVE